MGWQSGVFHREFSWTADPNAGFDILTHRMDSDTNDIVGDINNILTRDGQNVPGGNLPMAGFKHLNVAAATQPTDYARFDQVVKATGDATISGNLTAATLTGAKPAGCRRWTDAANPAGIATDRPAPLKRFSRTRGPLPRPPFFAPPPGSRSSAKGEEQTGNIGHRLVTKPGTQSPRGHQTVTVFCCVLPF
jgi:hypothetical protein